MGLSSHCTTVLSIFDVGLEKLSTYNGQLEEQTQLMMSAKPTALLLDASVVIDASGS